MSLNQNFKLLKNKRGQGLMEYLILVALVTVASIGVVRVVGSNISRQYAKINKSLGASDRSPELLKVDQDDIEKKDLSNFMSGARSEGSSGGK